MRITSEAMVLRSVDRLQSRLALYERSQTELATGRRILQPSDDPAGTRRALSLQSSLQGREQELANISDARGWLDTADTHLQTVTTRLARVRDLATQGASDQDDNVRRALAAEIRQITEELAGMASTTHLDRPLFGGFGTGEQVRRVDGAWQFPDARQAGEPDQITRRVSDSEQVRINVTAAEWLGTEVVGTDDQGAPVQGPQLLNFLERLATELETGDDPAVVGESLALIQTATVKVTDTLAQIGAATNRVESARARALDLQLTLRSELSQVENIDMAQGIMELQVQQVAYEATLQALAKALPPSLVAFLR
ncbi:flagellin N-terminal helical domain-containing protein [Egicoccus halophilus]|uniref:Flagellin n=1 Tax=Egicoccus halophilus TaxID=1670830 RepID=A0A8J3EUU1_9ACTN|nr:flagellin [Egicoccus halophilus]GGI06663.1 flagellar hook-associated protein FlgL [Egicoccus halophilus]